MNTSITCNVNQFISQRTNWESDFEKNMSAFSKKVSEGIAKEIFAKLQSACMDPYKLLPYKKSPLEFNFSFDIVNSSEALKLKTWAQDAADLPPFKEWMENLSKPNQQISYQNCTMQSSSSHRCRFTYLEGEKGIDGAYFQGTMSKVGMAVEKELRNLFTQYASSSANSSVKFDVTWYKTSYAKFSQVSCIEWNTQLFDEKYMHVKAWFEDQPNNQLAKVKSTAKSAIIIALVMIPLLALLTKAKNHI